jgi:hypothetical protein
LLSLHKGIIGLPGDIVKFYITKTGRNGRGQGQSYGTNPGSFDGKEWNWGAQRHKGMVSRTCVGLPCCFLAQGRDSKIWGHPLRLKTRKMGGQHTPQNPSQRCHCRAVLHEDAGLGILP